MKDPVKVAAGAKGGRAKRDNEARRLGRPTGPRVLRLLDLTPQQHRLVLALLDLGAEPTEAEPGAA